MKARTYIVFLLLRLGLAFPLLFAAVIAFYNPLLWADYIPDTVSFLPVNEITVIYLLGLIDAFLGFWILWGKRLLFPSVASAVLFGAIILSNADNFTVVFRDIASLSIAVVLAVWSYEPRNKEDNL